MPRQISFERVISQLRQFYSRSKRLPTYAELQELCGYQSKGGVSVLVKRLLEKRILHQDSKGKLLPSHHIQPRLKLLGAVQAGFPSPAEEELVDTMSLDEFLIQRPEASYLVKVSGDSMIDAGIHPGDLVIVERGRQPKPGDIVVAQVDGEWTMKYFEKQGGKIVLRAANKKYPLFAPKEELTIGGVVVANVRKYR